MFHGGNWVFPGLTPGWWVILSKITLELWVIVDSITHWSDENTGGACPLISTVSNVPAHGE